MQHHLESYKTTKCFGSSNIYDLQYALQTNLLRNIFSDQLLTDRLGLEKRENELQIFCSNSSKNQFKFDHVFRLEDSQEAVFLQTSPMVSLVLDRYYVCIIAYWTGKTFSMEGTSENRE
ncbi:hypothetical protein Vadar_032358 [Vaccinium darrowii]|uniref:Uncharacterized protein n=1 Tax=Vaccinium darrowii TaxID=229202 RepID=A0ACB7Z0X8_9ERIC|nr:hypothetical protein Vadar_032358 [Vaccinium darrowii]